MDGVTRQNDSNNQSTRFKHQCSGQGPHGLSKWIKLSSSRHDQDTQILKMHPFLLQLSSSAATDNGTKKETQRRQATPSEFAGPSMQQRRWDTEGRTPAKTGKSQVNKQHNLKSDALVSSSQRNSPGFHCHHSTTNLNLGAHQKVGLRR